MVSVPYLTYLITLYPVKPVCNTIPHVNFHNIVHSDVCGPSKVRSIGRVLYFFTFINDHSRKLWVRMLKSKDQVIDVFKEFHVFVERR